MFYRLEGRSGLPGLALSHSLGCDHSMWAPQMPELLEHFQVLRYDARGHGASEVAAGDYTLGQFGQDVLGLADRLGLKTFAFCGISMGGAVGQWLAINAPQRLTRLVLANTSPKFGTPDVWNARIKAVQEGGMAAIIDATIQRFFSGDQQESAWAQSTRRVLLGTDPKGYAACCSALRDADTRAELGKISVPTLVIGGDQDPSTPWEGNGSILVRDIPKAKAFRLQTAHLSNLEQPRAFTAAVLDFLLREKQPGD
ncbi:MAG TPA: 3-oxoadipate enol-lactonase [Candidatus Angelobacter sp.]|nr:3-oxoadipate enol-lactonase [Candidatus Angelobacter sp.]